MLVKLSEFTDGIEFQWILLNSVILVNFSEFDDFGEFLNLNSQFSEFL